MYYKEKTNRMLLALGLAVFALGMAAAAVWDLPLDQALHNPASAAAVLMENFGFYPLYLPPLLWLAGLALQPRFCLGARAGLLALALGGCAGFGVYSAIGLAKRGFFAPVLVAACVWAVLLAGAVCLFYWGRALRAQLQFVFFWGTVYMLLDNVVINILKILWNRTRFDDMLAAGSFEAFTAWLRPFAAGGTSFPSGHTAAACSVFVLVLLCDVLPAWHKRRTLVWGLCWAYIAGMALSRIVIGRHYLSDTLMAAFVMTLLFFGMVKSKPYRASLQKLEKAS